MKHFPQIVLAATLIAFAGCSTSRPTKPPTTPPPPVQTNAAPAWGLDNWDEGQTVIR